MFYHQTNQVRKFLKRKKDEISTDESQSLSQDGSQECECDPPKPPKKYICKKKGENLGREFLGEFNLILI